MKADRTAGFQQLFELIDWTALEFFDTDRTIFIGVVDNKTQPICFKFNSDNFKIANKSGQYYYPKVDTKINVSDALVLFHRYSIGTP